MIIAPDNNKPKRAPNATQEQQQPPPPYTDHPTSHTPGPATSHVLAAGPSQPLIRGIQHGQVPQSHPPRRGSPGIRFCKAFSIAFLIWLVFYVYMGTVVRIAVGQSRTKYYGDLDPLPGFSNPACDDWSTTLHGEKPSSQGYAYASFVSYELPLDASRHYFASRGQLANGAVKVMTSSQSTDHIVVDVGVYYGEQRLLDSVRACRIQQQDTYTEGVGIFTPNWYPPHHHTHIRFEMTIHIPEVKSQPLVLENLQTDMSLFAHEVENLSGKVFFNSLELRSSNSPIAAQGLEAHFANITTSNSGISGTYVTSDFLKLQTANAPIEVDVTLKNKAKDEDKTKLELHTSNGRIISVLHLESEHHGTGGNYSVNAQTSNSPFKIEFADAPKDSSLNFSAETSNSPASAYLHPTYQGTFALRSSIIGPRVDQHDPKDPTGADRKRKIQYSRRSGSTIEGNVAWDRRSTELGHVSLKTSNSPITLSL